MAINLVWLRRDLRLVDNTALIKALSEQKNVLPIFIFDEDIISELEVKDARLTFIYDQLSKLQTELAQYGSSLKILKGKVIDVWHSLVSDYEINAVYLNKDYEPYAIKRDQQIASLLEANGIDFHACKDQVIHEADEVLKADGSAYTVYTPYKNKWLSVYKGVTVSHGDLENLNQVHYEFPSIESLGFERSNIQVKDYDLSQLKQYAQNRDFPAIDGASYLSPHLRFGTVSPRQVIAQLQNDDAVFLSELIWREFFMQILFHFPRVVTENFKAKYDGIQWRNNEKEFEKWCQGKTGYPMVDAGMRQLDETGYMHNRVRMITAGFLCKHLLIDWRWGEAYFAKHLLDYELSSNNGNWQWAAGTGCDAAPYFRIFNPSEQHKKFDPESLYVKRWVPEFGTDDYPSSIVDHKEARNRALTVYKAGILTSA